MLHAIYNYIFGYIDVKCTACNKTMNISNTHYGYIHNTPIVCSKTCENKVLYK